LISDYYNLDYYLSQYYPSEENIVYPNNQPTGFYNYEVVSAPAVVIESVPAVILNFGSSYYYGYGWGGYPIVKNNTYNNYTQNTYNYYNNSLSRSQPAQRFNERTQKQQNFLSKEEERNRNSLYNAQQSYSSQDKVSSYNKTPSQNIPPFGKASIHEEQQNYHLTDNITYQKNPLQNPTKKSGEFQKISHDGRVAHPGFQGIDSTKYTKNPNINDAEAGMNHKTSSNKNFSQNRAQQNLGQGNELSRPASTSMNAHPGFHGIDPTQYANYSNHQNSGAPRSSQNPIEISKLTGLQGTSPANYSRNPNRNNNPKVASPANQAEGNAPLRYSGRAVSSGNNNFAGRGEGHTPLTGQLHSSTPPQTRNAQSHLTESSNTHASSQEANGKLGTIDHGSGYSTRPH